MKKKNIKKNIIIFLVILIGVVVGVLINQTIKKNDVIKKELAMTYVVKKEIVENVIEISGNIKAAEIQTLQAQSDGTVKHVYVKEGDFVKKGQVILQLDSDEEDFNIEKHDYDYEQTKIQGSVRELEIMQKQREMLLKKLEKRQVIARIDGTLVSLTADMEDYFEAATELGTIVDRSYLQADVEVVETDAPKLKVGQKVIMTFPSYEKELEGIIVSYPAVGRITSRGASVVDAEIRLENPPKEILPGYSFTGKIEISAPEEILLIEKKAIFRDLGKMYVDIITPQKEIEHKQVKAVPYDNEYVKIISGLKEGQVLKAQKQEPSGKNVRNGKMPTANKTQVKKGDETNRPGGFNGPRP